MGISLKIKIKHLKQMNGDLIQICTKSTHWFEYSILKDELYCYTCRNFGAGLMQNVDSLIAKRYL